MGVGERRGDTHVRVISLTLADDAGTPLNAYTCYRKKNRNQFINIAEYAKRLTPRDISVIVRKWHGRRVRSSAEHRGGDCIRGARDTLRGGADDEGVVPELDSARANGRIEVVLEFDG